MIDNKVDIILLKNYVIILILSSLLTSMTVIRDTFGEFGQNGLMDNLNFKTHFIGKDGFIWWIGQIPDEKVSKTLE